MYCGGAQPRRAGHLPMPRRARAQSSTNSPIRDEHIIDEHIYRGVIAVPSLRQSLGVNPSVETVRIGTHAVQ